MKINFTPKTLTFTPETKKEAIELNKHFKAIDPAEEPEKYIDQINNLEPIKEKASKKGLFCRVTVESDGLHPYFDALNKWVNFPEFKEIIELPELQTIKHTYIIEKAVLKGKTLEITGIVALFENQWAENDAVLNETNAQKKLLDYLNEDLMHRPNTPEFIQAGNGHFHRNPKYATGHKEPIQRIMNPFHGDFYWSILFNLWLNKCSNKAQKEFLNKCHHFHGYKGPIRHDDYSIYVLDPAGTCNYDGKGTMVTVYNTDQTREIMGKLGRVKD